MPEGETERSDEGPGLLPSSSRSPRRPTRHDAGRGRRPEGRTARGNAQTAARAGAGLTAVKLTVVRWAFTRGLAGPGS